MDIPFKLNHEYSRTKEIHTALGGNPKHGSIQKAQTISAVMLFSGEYGNQDWYIDHWSKTCDAYKFCGSGLPGSMVPTHHNSIILHVREDVKLLIFRSSGKGQKYTYLGEFYYWKYQYEPSNVDPMKWPDILVFYLVPSGHKGLASNPEELLSKTRALSGKHWGTPPLGQPHPQRVETPGAYAHKRDPETRAFVLARGNGFCECCKMAAPFEDGNGLPFLEAHHLIPLSDDGPDTWYNLVAVCPNCHRELHYGANRISKFENLQTFLLKLRKQHRMDV